MPNYLFTIECVIEASSEKEARIKLGKFIWSTGKKEAKEFDNPTNKYDSMFVVKELGETSG